MSGVYGMLASCPTRILYGIVSLPILCLSFVMAIPWQLFVKLQTTVLLGSIEWC